MFFKGSVGLSALLPFLFSLSQFILLVVGNGVVQRRQNFDFEYYSIILNFQYQPWTPQKLHSPICSSIILCVSVDMAVQYIHIYYKSVWVKGSSACFSPPKSSSGKLLDLQLQLAVSSHYKIFAGCSFSNVKIGLLFSVSLNCKLDLFFIFGKKPRACWRYVQGCVIQYICMHFKTSNLLQLRQ